MENNVEIDERVILETHFDYYVRECDYIPNESDVSIKDSLRQNSPRPDNFIEGQLLKTKSSSDPGKLNKITGAWLENRMRKFGSDKNIKQSSTIIKDVRLRSVLYNRNDLNSFIRFCESVSKETLYMVYFYIETVNASELIIKTYTGFDKAEQIIRRYITPSLITLSDEETTDMNHKFYFRERTLFERVLRRVGFHLEIIFSKWLNE
jgi:hypothetical protein